eukprot:scaffold865_cov181-Pinguiococcus_pyrenoidosus.AAC.1
MTNARDTVRGRDTWRTPSRARDATPYYIQYDLRAIDIRKLIDMQAFDNSRNWSRVTDAGFGDLFEDFRISKFQTSQVSEFRRASSNSNQTNSGRAKEGKTYAAWRLEAKPLNQHRNCFRLAS